MNVKKIKSEYYKKIDGYDKSLLDVKEQIRKNREDESLAYEKKRLDDLRQLCIQFIRDLDDL